MSTAEDLLPDNKKRHDINLTISQRTMGYADQTPTPTRFIRNCEEVGLFQDLQNVNPFEETFRKAVEAVHQGETLVLGKTDDRSYVDDTLHTPNVFPLIPDVLIRKEVHHAKPVIDAKPPLVAAKPDQPKKIRKYRKRKAESELVCQPTFVVPEKNITFMLPIPRLPSSSVNCFSPKYFSVLSKNVTKNCRISEEPAEKNVASDSKKSDLMEYNRLAQMRTRRKRKNYLGYLEDSKKKLTEKLTTLEKRLKATLEENATLKNKIKLFEDKPSIGFDASTQTTNPSDKKIPLDHDYILPTDPEEKCEPGVIIKKPFKKRHLQPKLCISCNKNPV